MNDEILTSEPEIDFEAQLDEEALAPEEEISESPAPEIESEAPDTQSAEALKREIEALRAEISRLETERDTQSRILKEISDFNSLFPYVEMDSIPESVWESVRNGTPLIASYALYEKRLAAEEARIAKINAANASRSPGIAGRDLVSEYFTPDEVKKMSRSEVHANYSKIKESMKKWMEI